LNILRRYLPCVVCEHSFDPYLPACPGCGERPPDEALTNLAYRVPNRVLAEALAAARQAATPAPAPAAAAKQTESAAKRNGTANGAGRPAPKRAVMDNELPQVAPKVYGNGNGASAQPASISGGMDGNAEFAPEGEAREGSGVMFAEAETPRIEVAGTMDTEYELIEDAARLAEVVSLLSDEQVVSVDTETTGLDPFADNALLLVQVATRDRAYLLDARRVDPRPLRRVLEDHKMLKLLQNAKFDYKMLRYQAGIGMRNMYDTMLVERVLTAGISREIGLAKIALKYTGLVLDKAIRSSFIDKTGAFTDDQLRYAARDAQILFTVYAAQREQLKRERLREVALLEFKTVVAVSEMELAGCLIDKDRWRGIIEGATADRDRVALELGDLLADAIPQMSLFGGPAINLNSNAQLLETFKRMGIDLPDTMEGTLSQHNEPAIKKLLEYRGFEKMISAFGEKFLALIHPKTGRIHPDFNQMGADTGRFSCTNPNIQQIPSSSDFRSCFIAAPGYKLITCDYSQAELRILAQLSEDPAFVEAFQSGGDLHQLTASQMYQVPPDQVTKKQRGAAKVINFGLAYGRGPAALGVQLEVSTEDAKGLIDQYFKAYSGIQRWLDRAGREAVRKGYSATMLGRKRYYPPLDRDDIEFNKKRSGIERQGKNSPIQGSNADMTKFALIGINEALQDYDARIVNTVHDEIVVEAREDQAEVVCKIVEQEMVKAGERIVTLVPIVADAKIADYWSK
jgi:DNA polymerase I-like protein with 3'-5' exonuclease and polymerase domains